MRKAGAKPRNKRKSGIYNAEKQKKPADFDSAHKLFAGYKGRVDAIRKTVFSCGEEEDAVAVINSL